MENIRFAFALNHAGLFNNQHFGEADKFAIYQNNKGKLDFWQDLPNHFKITTPVHGSTEKGNGIVSLLKENGISILVSQQFGRNIKMVSQHFIPVIISGENPVQVAEILAKNIKWLKDELENRKSNFMLFKINTGILKLAIK